MLAGVGKSGVTSMYFLHGHTPLGLQDCLPVKWYQGVVGVRLRIGVDHEPHMDTLHQWQQLVPTHIECAGSVVIHEPVL